MLLVHGAGAGAWEWAIWQRCLAARGVRSGCAQLEPLEGALEATGYADYLAQLVAQLAQIPRPRLLVGASLGARLLLDAADLDDDLVLINPLCPDPEREWPARVPWSDTGWARTARSLPDADPGTWEFATARWRDESGRVLREACARPWPSPRAGRGLLISSACDQDVPAASQQTLAECLSFPRIVIDDQSHAGALLGRRAADLAAWVMDWWRLVRA